MEYQSTRSGSKPVGFFEAFAAGLAPDGGLYVPEALPRLPDDLATDSALPYPALAFDMLGMFDTDHSGDDLINLIDKSYGSFTDLATAPLKKLADNLFVLELFHGPTLAFKDFGLQLVGNLFEDQIQRTGRSINVLGATSGDTGSAAIHGLANKEGVNVFILYPRGRVSELQERQMTCTGAKNIFPIPIEGTFDDAQYIVKELFGDLEFKAKTSLSAINSINLARILAQAIYYVHAWMQLPDENRSRVSYVVPTGNFGNILAGWLASRMGLPGDRFVLATNQNDILYRLFTTGVYEPGAVRPSLAPSMDIQIASNFERFLFYQLDGDGARVNRLMQKLRDGKNVKIPQFDPDLFAATRSKDADIVRNIQAVHERYGYVVDPHTACGFQKLDESYTNIVLATAHPAKFPETIEGAIGLRPTHPSLEVLKGEEPMTYPLEPTISAVRTFIEANMAED